MSAERLGRIVEEAASEVYIFSASDFRFRLVNKGARDNLGYNAEELAELTPWDLKPRLSREAFLDIVKPLLSGQVELLEFETVHARKDGTEYNVDVKLQLFEEGGDVVFYAAIQDTTAIRDLAVRYEVMARQLDTILENTQMSVFVMDENQHCTFMNSAAETLTGYSLAETAGRPLHDVIHHTRPDGSPFPISECAIDNAFPENVGTQGEEVFVHKDGSFYPVAFTASPLRDDKGRTTGTIIEVRNISDEKRADEARQLLMREVDHRARNVLSIVQSLIRLTRAEEIEAYKSTLAGRVNALARAQTSLADRKWEGGGLEEVVQQELSALCPPHAIKIEGPDIIVVADRVQPISMLLHELATNANKYGALSQPEGRVAISWTIAGDHVALTWLETGGPPVSQRDSVGFGTTLQDSVVRQLRGSITRRWEPTGLVAEVRFPI
ncbi:MAG: PAS domain S-box protein [Alphaproteobacteria bacterium]|nr:PAS domain S-box protein [Alphaproteobacteria bacterium]